MILVITMVLSLVLTMIPVSADGVEQCRGEEIAVTRQYADKNCN